jgi:hypothetical protein
VGDRKSIRAASLISDRQAPGHIDLLIAYLGLPGGMNARQVTEQAKLLRP